MQQVSDRRILFYSSLKTKKMVQHCILSCKYSSPILHLPSSYMQNWNIIIFKGKASNLSIGNFRDKLTACQTSFSEEKFGWKGDHWLWRRTGHVEARPLQGEKNSKKRLWGGKFKWLGAVLSYFYIEIVVEHFILNCLDSYFLKNPWPVYDHNCGWSMVSLCYLWIMAGPRWKGVQLSGTMIYEPAITSNIDNNRYIVVVLVYIIES